MTKGSLISYLAHEDSERVRELILDASSSHSLFLEQTHRIARAFEELDECYEKTQLVFLGANQAQATYNAFCNIETMLADRECGNSGIDEPRVALELLRFDDLCRRGLEINDVLLKKIARLSADQSVARVMARHVSARVSA